MVLLPVLGIRRGEWISLADWRLVLRAALIAGGIGCTLAALRSTEPLSAVFGAIFISPGVTYALSVLLLGERTSRARTALLLAGFAGVLVVVRPSGDVGPNIVFALMAGAFYGGYLTATRWLAATGEHRPGFLLVSQLILGAVLLAPLGGPAIPALAATGWGLVLVSALSSAASNYIVVRVSRTVPSSVVAPLIYTQLISATAAGVLVFGERPDAWTLGGPDADPGLRARDAPARAVADGQRSNLSPPG